MGAVWSSVDNILVLVSTYLQVLTQKWWCCHHAARSMIAVCAHLKKKKVIHLKFESLHSRSYL